jgi:phage terminase large subunit
MTLGAELETALATEFRDRKSAKSKPRRSINAQFAESLAWYRDHPVEFVRDVIGAEPDEWQADALTALRNNQKVAISGCTGSGKDWLAACWNLYRIACFPLQKGLATANSRDQLNDVLWAEIHMILRSAPSLQRIIEWTSTEIHHVSNPAEWFTACRVASLRYSPDGNVQVEGLAGRHAENLTLTIDEASGVPNPFFVTFENTMTSGPENKLLVIGNPLRVDGAFYEIFNKPKKAEQWVKFYVGAIGGEYERHIRQSDTGKRYVSSHSDKARALALIHEKGVEHPEVQARVFGNFPEYNTIDTAFTRAQIIDAMNRVVTVKDDDEIQIGIDCARYGDDETVFFVRIGWKVLPPFVMAKSGAPDIFGKTVELINKYTRRGKRPQVRIDDAGAGGGGSVVDLLWRAGFADCVVGVGFGEEADNSDHYFNLAAEMWLDTLVRVMPNVQLPDDEQLLTQLTSRKYEYTGVLQQRRLESKDKMKRDGKGSPDRADALCLAFVQRSLPGIY